MDKESQASTVTPPGEPPLQNVSNTQPTKPTQVPEAREEISRRHLLRSIVIVLLATFSLVTNTGLNTSTATAMPTIGKEFGADPSLLQWVVAAYPLASGCSLLMWGRLADLYGRKKAYLCGMAFLFAFTLGCGFADRIITLIVLRGFQGVSVAAVIPASFGILAQTFPPSKARALAFATFSAGAPVGAAFGSAVGGVLTERTAKTWRSNYFMFAGINAICFIVGLVTIKKDIPTPKENRKVDWLGAFLITAALVLILFVLGDGESAPNKWATGYIIATLVIGVCLIGVFVYWQWFLEKAQNERLKLLEQEEEKAITTPAADNGESPPTTLPFKKKLNKRLPPPLMKLSLWKRANGRFAVMMVIACLTWCSFFGWMFWVQLYYQNYLGLKPLQSVVRLVPPMFIAGITCNAFVGIVASYMPMIALSTIGTLATAIACLLFAVVNPKATYWAFGFPAAVLTVVGADFVFTAGTLYIAKISLPHEQSLAGASFQTMIQLGTSAGVTISTVVFNRVKSHVDIEAGDMIRSYRAAQWTTCAFGLLGAVLSLVFFRGVGVPGHRRVKTPPVETGRKEPEKGEETTREQQQDSGSDHEEEMKEQEVEGEKIGV